MFNLEKTMRKMKTFLICIGIVASYNSFAESILAKCDGNLKVVKLDNGSFEMTNPQGIRTKLHKVGKDSAGWTLTLRGVGGQSESGATDLLQVSLYYASEKSNAASFVWLEGLTGLPTTVLRAENCHVSPLQNE